MRCYQRALRGVEHLVERSVGQVRYVHDHAKPFHLGHDAAAEGAKPVVARRPYAPRDGVPAVPGQGHEADAGAVERAELVQALAYGLAALDGQEGGDPALGLGPARVVRAERLEGQGRALAELVQGADQGPAMLARHAHARVGAEDGEELGADARLDEPGQVYMAARRAEGQVARRRAGLRLRKADGV